MVSKIFTIDEVAEHLRIKPRTVREWIYRGKIKSFKMGDLVRIHEDQLQDFIAGASGISFRIVENIDEKDKS